MMMSFCHSRNYQPRESVSPPVASGCRAETHLRHYLCRRLSYELSKKRWLSIGDAARNIARQVRFVICHAGEN